MNFRDYLLIIFIALLVGTVAGIMTNSIPAWIAVTFILGGVLLSLWSYIRSRRERKRSPQEPEFEEKAREMSESSLVDGVNPDLEKMNLSGDYIDREHMIEAFSAEFNIPREKAERIYEAGYTHWGDFSEAIPADLTMIPGINPTLSRKIISTVRSRK
ncbi:MAG: hypothetical protein ACMUIG_09975 [Thermoplasmatota archaeon]